MSEYSLADLTRIVGAKRRTVQLWAEAGVIKADPETQHAGTGTHRRFSRTEAIIACLVYPFSSRQMAIGELLAVSFSVREFIELRGGKKLFDKFISGETDGYLTFADWGEFRYRTTIREIAPERPPKELWEGVGERAIQDLENPGAMSMVIKLSTYLSALR